jgi:cation transport regulator ChaB
MVKDYDGALAARFSRLLCGRTVPVDCRRQHSNHQQDCYAAAYAQFYSALEQAKHKRIRAQQVRKNQADRGERAKRSALSVLQREILSERLHLLGHIG